MMKAGMTGQVKGPFTAGRNIFQSVYNTYSTNAQKMRFGVSISNQDLMPLIEQRLLKMTLNGEISIEIGKTGMYEITDPIQVYSLSFDIDVPASVIVNYIIY